MTQQLLEVQAKTRLSLGKSIAQFLSRQDEADYAVLKWLTISKGGDYKSYSIYYSEVIEEEEGGLLDIVELTPVDPDDSPIINEFDAIEEALDFATATYGASRHKYVAESMVSEQYTSYLKERNR
jgi:hypothetical protein